MSEEIKSLAQECLNDKWNLSIENWISDCAFCKDAKIRENFIPHPDKHSEPCRFCLVGNQEFCKNIKKWEEREDKTIIIKVLEELVENGETTQATKDELNG